MANIKDSKQVMIIRLKPVLPWEWRTRSRMCISHVDCQRAIHHRNLAGGVQSASAHSSLRHLTPNEFIIQHQANAVAEEVVYSG
jgi:hypothetical protein